MEVLFLAMLLFLFLIHFIHSLLCLQPVGDDGGFLSVRPEGGSGSGPAFLPQSGSAPQAAAGLPVC